uniref:Uncharacterized protein LOC105061109 n=1 Tax=Elaeis guineensis var. tenera TaxID=51953 RepID=A0A6I9SHX2_ELAGV|nr:uncharacterized protein LOC105061109 [Elaeis guineensis]
MVFKSKGIPEEWKKTMIALILKQPDASTPGHFKPISLYTILYKEAFISDRSIIDNILLAQKFTYDLHQAPIHHSLMAIKLDMERAYDRMSWHFLRQMLRELDFHEQWIDGIMDCVEVLSFAILINGTPMEFFT